MQDIEKNLLMGSPLDVQGDIGADVHPQRGKKKRPAARQAYWKPFGMWLRQRRTKVNLTQERAAYLAGVTASHWAKIEKGVTGTTPATITLLAKAVSADPREAYHQYGLLDMEPVTDSVRGRRAGIRTGTNISSASVTLTELSFIARGLEKAVRLLNRDLNLLNKELDTINKMIARRTDI